MSKSCIIVMLLPFGGYTLAADRRRCRSLNHFGEIPPLLNSSTFYNLGHPLISKLCQESVNDQLLHDTVGCLAVRKRVWPVKCTDSARSGSGSSAIVIDPHVIAVRGHTSSAGVYVINALYPKLYELGYSPKVRYWSNELNDHFENSTSQIASNQSQLWDHYELGNADNPYIAIDNYILLQTEASNFFTQSIRTISNISESAHGRVFQWMIGLQHSSAHSFYASKVDEAHCLGANHFLGEGLYCSSASVISCPMFPFHRTESRAVNDKTRKALKQNIVLIDSDIMGNEISVERLQNALIALGVSDVQVLVHKGRQRHEVPELYVRTKVSIDCNNGGVEFINYEATLYDVLTLSCNSRATRNAFDYPVPSKYLLEPTNWPQLVNTVHKLLVNYTDHVPEFRHFKALSQSSDERALTQLDMTFFSRDVIFRTYCESYSQCRRTIPWAVAVWILYPLSRIEVYTTLPEKQYRLDNDVTLTTLARSFNKKHFNVAQVKEGFPHPVTNFAFAPCRYVVFMHPTVLPFGRDFLNTHMHYMENNNISQPIAYWEENKLLVSISSSTLFGKFIKIAGQADVYLEHLDTLRLVENYEVYARLRGSGVWEYKTVPEGYLHNRTTGTSGAEATVVGPALTLRECMALYNTEWSVHNTVVPTQPLVMDMLVIPEDWVDTDTGVDSCEQNYKTGGAPETACDHPDLSGLPICTAPISRVPYFWLTSATPRLTVGRALCLNQSTFEHIVQHLDPIVQDSLMQKIFGFIPTDIAQILRLFDAVSFPNVVSLVDSRHQNWIENCTN